VITCRAHVLTAMLLETQRDDNKIMLQIATEQSRRIYSTGALNRKFSSMWCIDSN